MPITTARLTVRELKCFLCGFTLGELVVQGARRQFHRAADCPPLTETRLSRLRCVRCSGPVYLEGAETTTQWTLQSRAATSAGRNN